MAETRSEFLKSNTAMTRSEFKNFLHETRSNFAQSNPKRKRAPSPSNSVKDLRLKRVSVGVDIKVKSDVQDDAKKTRASDVNGVRFDSQQSDSVPQPINLDNLSTRNLVDVNVERSAQISDEVKLENPNENKLKTPLCPRSKLVQNSSSVSFKRLLPFLKNLTEDESSGIKICHSYDHLSNNGKILLQDANIIDGVKAAEASDEMNVCNSLVTKTASDADLTMKVDANAEQSAQISDEVKMENPKESKSETPLCPRSKLVQNSSSVGFRRLFPYLKNLIEDESSGIKICHSYDRSSNNGKILLQDASIMGRLDGVIPAEASDDKNACSSLVNKTGISSSLLSRLIGNQNSPSYKRLLPYLNDLAKDDSSKINTGSHCSLVNAENNTNEIHFQSSEKVSHSVMSEDTVVSPVVDDIDPILKRNNSSSLGVLHKPINEERTHGQLDEISMKFKKGTFDLSQNGTDILDVLVDCNTDIVQSTSDANMPANSAVVNDKDTILKTNGSHSFKATHEPTNEEFNDVQIDGISVDDQKGMNDFTKNDAEIFEVSVNYNTGIIQSTSPDANLSMDNLVHDKDMILERNSSYSLEVSYKSVNEDLTDGQIEEISKEGQKGMNDSSINDAEILELSVNYDTGIVQSASPDANTLKYKDGFQSTPPDADIVNKLNDKNVSEGSPSDACLASESNAGEGRLVTALVDNIMPKKNLSPDSCSRSKLYRNSSSFSYRRLLPYLTSLATSFAKTETDVLDVTQSQPSIATADNGSVEKSMLSNGIPLTVEQTDTYSSRDHNLMEKHISEDTHFFSEGNDHLYNNTELENFESEMVHKLSSTPSIFSNLSLDELSGGAMITNKEPLEEVSTGKTDRNQFLATKKGILKRNYSKVCKGRCMCLDCDLHRVNAEKAFEFSRKQMLCANEVVDGLIKEMSCLRKTVESSVATMINGSESYTVLQVDQKQVRGVCQRAHKVEEHAKSYMRQMFSDLNNHCRSPGPKVTFSDIVQEKSHP